MKTWPAIDVRAPSDPDHILAAADDFSPTAAEERGDVLRLFFASSGARDAAVLALGPSAVPIEVDDEDWVARSQASLTPIAVGRVVVLPDADAVGAVEASHDRSARAEDSSVLSIVIRPSMGFGTGHHATTQLCLRALQDLDIRGLTVLDVGTGSGILAIAASRLGADAAIGIDTDPDAIDSANLNLTLNPQAANVRFAVDALESGSLPTADLVLANLTGALLVREAEALLAAVRPSGALVVSGILEEEERHVRLAFAGASVTRRRQEGEWIGLTFNREVSFSV